MTTPLTWPQRAWLALLLGIFGALIVGRALTRDINHDEHQFLAPAALLAREGLLPYRDYPLFHLPNLTLNYALLDRTGPQLLLSAKLFSAFSTVAVCALLCLVCLRGSFTGNHRLRWLAAAGLLALLFLDPLFQFTIGKTWNHEFPAFCIVSAIVLTAANAKRDRAAISLFAGLLAGLAAGSRLTFITIAAPLCLAPLLFGFPPKHKVRLILFSSLGLFLALLPTFWLFALAPENFIFDNFQFPRLRLLDPDDSRAAKTVTLWRKLRFFFKEIALPGWMLFAAYAAIGIAPAVRWFRERSPDLLPAALTFLSIPFTLAGCFAPSRYQLQHFYIVLPLLALGIAYGLNVPWTRIRFSKPTVVAAWSGAAILIVGGWLCVSKEKRREYHWLGDMVQPHEWYPTRMDAMTTQLRAQVPSGKVLTLAPIWPLNAGLPIYPEFATGLFAWRGAHLLEPEKRARLKFVAPDDLESFLAKDPPAAIMTGFEKEKFEEPFVNYAKRHAYRPVDFGRKGTLWLK